jgi:hypothetical protein
LKGGDKKKAAFFYDSCGHNLYVFNPTDSSWAVAGGAGGLNQLTGDVTAGPGIGSQPATIANNAVTNAKFRQSAGLSVIGNSSNATANVADITAGSDGGVLRRNGTSIGFGAVNLANGNAVTGVLPIANIDTTSPNGLMVRSTCQWPAEQTIGTIYEKSSWVNTNDFTPAGSATMNLNGQYLDISGGSGTFGVDYLKVLGPTGLQKWKMTAVVKLTGALTASSGMAFGLKYLNAAAPYDFCGSLALNSSLSTPIYIAQSSGTVLQTSAGSISFSQNDIIKVTVEYRDSAFIVAANNVTTGGSTVTATYTIPDPTAGAGKAPARCYFALYATSGTQQLQYLKIESAETQFPSLVLEGDSKTQLGFADAFTRRIGNQLNSTYPTVVTHAGEGDGVEYALGSIDEIKKIGGRVIINNIGSNSLRQGKTFAQLVSSYDSLTLLEQSTGAIVYHIVMPEDTVDNTTNAVGMTPLKNYIAAKYSSYYIAGVWDTLQDGSNRLKSDFDSGDGVHLNQAGDDAVVAKILQFGIPFCRQRLQDYSFISAHIPTGGGGNASGSSNRVAKFTSANTVGNGSLFDNGSIGFNTTTPINQFEISGNNTANSTFKAGTLEVQSSADGNGFISNNGYFNTVGGSWIRRVADEVSILQFNGSNLFVYTAPTGTAGSTATITQRFSVDPTAVKVLNGNIFRADAGIGIGQDPTSSLILNTYKNQNATTGGFLTNDNASGSAMAAFAVGNDPGNFSLNNLKLFSCGTGFTPASLFKANTTCLEGTGSNMIISQYSDTEPMQFATDRTERMRIAPSGNLLIGTTTDNSIGKLQVNGKATIATIDSASAANMLWADPATGEIKKAAVPTGGTSDLTGAAIKTNIHIVDDADYTVASTDYIILYKTMTVGRTLTLPSAASSTNRMLIIKNGGAGAFSITTSQTLRENSLTTGTTISSGQSYGIVSDGTDWWIVWISNG